MGEEGNWAYSGLETCNLNSTTVTSADDMFVDECCMLEKVFFHTFLIIRVEYMSMETVTAFDKFKFDLASVQGQNNNRKKNEKNQSFFVCL